MSPEQIETAAAALATARQGQPISRLPETARPQSEAECYAIQDAVLRRLRENVGGYKVGFSPEGGIFCAPIYASKVHASPARLPASFPRCASGGCFALKRPRTPARVATVSAIASRRPWACSPR